MPQIISAQISLYPLRRPELSPAIEEILQVLRSKGLEVRQGAMSTLVAGEQDLVWDSLKDAWRRAAAGGDLVLVATFSNACPR
jgi:uncharacterized protein YqgV (UPF0045/DUF77 family)